MIRGYDAGEFAFVLSTTVEGGINRYLLFSNYGSFNLGPGSLAPSTLSGTEDGRFSKTKLKPAQEDGVEVVSFDGRVDGHPIAGSIARLAPLNDEGDTILNSVTRVWLGIDRPRRMKFVFVDDDLGGG